MKTKQTLDELKNLGVDTQRFDINQRIQMIIDEQNRWLEKIGNEAAEAYGLSEKGRAGLKLGGI